MDRISVHLLLSQYATCNQYDFYAMKHNSESHNIKYTNALYTKIKRNEENCKLKM